MKVLVGIDSAATYQRVVSFFKRNAWFRNAEVRLVYVVSIPMFDSGFDPGVAQEMMNNMTDSGKEILQRAADELQPVVAKQVQTVSAIGEPASVLIDEVKFWHPDIVVVDAHHHAVWEKLFLGSVSKFVADHAPCTVLILKDESVGQSPEPQPDMIFCTQCGRSFLSDDDIPLRCPACSNQDRATLPTIYHHDDPIRAEMLTSADWQAGD